MPAFPTGDQVHRALLAVFRRRDEVIDLGTDVPPRKFVDAMPQQGPAGRQLTLIVN